MPVPSNPAFRVYRFATSLLWKGAGYEEFEAADVDAAVDYCHAQWPGRGIQRDCLQIFTPGGPWRWVSDVSINLGGAAKRRPGEAQSLRHVAPLPDPLPENEDLNHAEHLPNRRRSRTVSPQTFNIGDSVLIRMPAGFTAGIVVSPLAEDGRHSVSIEGFATLQPLAGLLSRNAAGAAE